MSCKACKGKGYTNHRARGRVGGWEKRPCWKCTEGMPSVIARAARLKAAGWNTGGIKEFLKLTDEEVALVETRHREKATGET